MSDLDPIAAALRGEAVHLEERLVALAEAHRVDALLAVSPAAAAAAPDLQARLKQRRAAYEVIGAARDVELRRVLSALAAGGVHAVVVKGAHLAHALYAAPGLRPRADNDLVIDADDRSQAPAVLDRLGYQPAVHVRGDLILGQWHFRREEPGGLVHALDLHWRIAAPLVFRHLMPAARLRSRGVPIPALGDAAVGPAPADALAIACVHLVAHHRRDPLLLWLYDIAILARSLDAAARQTFVETARDASVLAVCIAALSQARRHFAESAIDDLLRSLDVARSDADEPSAAILGAGTPLAELWLDVKTCDGWRERAALVREHAYPARDYVRATSGVDVLLPWAYAARLVRGSRRWLSAK